MSVWRMAGRRGAVVGSQAVSPSTVGTVSALVVPAFLESLLLWLGLQQAWATLFDGALAVLEGGVLHGGRKEPG